MIISAILFGFVMLAMGACLYAPFCFIVLLIGYISEVKNENRTCKH